ncbi:sugar ABC transporter substrate-binding protein [Rhodococcus koreensis]|uniref:sugar ABC transporter substrate-binding protein n=1 Tax=Rhodococcus koreensis TaxID=99653 RepID=UPI00366CD496
MRTIGRRIGTVITGAALVISASAACSSSGSGADRGTTPQENIDNARARVAQLEQPPTVDYDPGPLPGNPAGKRIVVALPTTAKGSANDALFRHAAEQLGIEVEIRNVDTTSEKITDTFDEIARDPNLDGLYVNSRDPSLWQAQFDQIAGRGVPIVLGAITDDPAWTSRSVNVMSSSRVVKQITEDAADWMVADSNGTGSSVVFTIPVQRTLSAIGDTYRARLNDTCPGCGVDVVDVKGFSSIGKDLPGTVVSYLQSHPDVKYVFLAFGDMVTGVPDALRAAGLSDVKLSTQSAGASNIQYLNQGTEAADLAYTHPYMAYVAVDALARGMLGGSMQTADQWLMPTQLLTPANVGSANVNQEGTIVLPELDEHFTRIWGKGTPQ